LQGTFYGHDEEIQCRDSESLELRAAYEALQKELGYSKMAADAEAEFANEYKAKFEALKAENEALVNDKEQQAKRIEELEKCVEILQRPLDDEIISRIIVLVKNVSDEELASNVFESVRNMTNWNKSTPAEFLVLFDKTAASKNGDSK